MRTGLAKRLDRLERRNRPPGRMTVFYLNDWQNPTATDIAEDERRLADVRAELGADDTLVVVEYVRDWRQT